MDFLFINRAMHGNEGKGLRTKKNIDLRFNTVHRDVCKVEKNIKDNGGANLFSNSAQLAAQREVERASQLEREKAEKFKVFERNLRERLEKTRIILNSKQLNDEQDKRILNRICPEILKRREERKVTERRKYVYDKTSQMERRKAQQRSRGPPIKSLSTVTVEEHSALTRRTAHKSLLREFEDTSCHAEPCNNIC